MVIRILMRFESNVESIDTNAKSVISFTSEDVAKWFSVISLKNKNRFVVFFSPNKKKLIEIKK